MSPETARGVERIIEPRLGGQVEDALGVIGGGFIQLGALGGEADLGEAQDR